MLDRPQRRGAILILVVGLAWLVAAAVGTALATGLDPATLEPQALARYVATVVVRFAPPVAVTLLAVELLRRAGRRDDEAIAELEARTAAAAAAGHAVRDGLLDLDATLTAIGGRLDDLRAATATEVPKLTGAAKEVAALSTALAATGERTVAAARGLTDTVPATQAAADHLTATLAGAGDAMAAQVDAVGTQLDRVAERQAAVGAQADTITAATLSAAAAIGDRTAHLDAAVDAALTRTSAALDAVRDGVDAQSTAMLAAIDAQGVALMSTIDAARSGLDAIGGGSAATIRARIDHVVAASASLGASLADHDTRTAALIATIERSFTVLDKRLAHAAAMGTATLDAFETRMTAVRDAADAVPSRLDAAATRLSEIEGAAVRLAATAGTAEGLAGHLAAASTPAQRLAANLAEARAAVAGIEEAAHGSALAGAHQLIEVLARVREVATAAAGTLRDTLADVVAEAETALAEAGHRTAASAFADPIRHEIAGLEGAATMAGDAAQATADRIAARLLGLTQVVATVEKRLAETSSH